jgi:hypothetical protein
MRDDDIRYWCEMAEAIAWREMIVAVQEQGENALRPEWAEVGGAVAFALRGMDHPFFNRVVGLGIPRPATRRDVEDLDAFFRGLGREWSVVQLVEPTQPPELVEWIAAAGFALSKRWPKLWRSLEGELPEARTDLRIEAVGPDRAEDFGRIVITAFDFDPALAPIATSTVGHLGWTHYLGFDGDESWASHRAGWRGSFAWSGCCRRSTSMQMSRGLTSRQRMAGRTSRT